MKLKYPRTVEKGGISVPPPVTPQVRRRIDWAEGKLPTLKRKRKRAENTIRSRRHDPRQGGENIRRFLN